MSLGATVLDGLVGNVSRCRRKPATPQFYRLGDDDDVIRFRYSARLRVALSPKTVAGSVPMSRRLLKQSSPSIEAMIQADLQRGAGLAIDLAALEGTGVSNQPQGIANVTGVNTQTVATPGQPTWNELVGFDTAVADDEALDGSLAYVTTSGVRGKLKTTAEG
ncbi:phage major capsid protein [Thiohalophilus sp.]|uniref:phage major capsid protein n=1 Tax=Thiohalophilus sp. TaxID=3028392 RepID=UPI002ACD700C|nr:phage major capsid protein [Thiohalophilus sp.]MDZ7804328.1 phage major capsid protein [Thiohalophilus sp.]